MLGRCYKYCLLFLSSTFILSIAFLHVSAAPNLSGRILLQVEDKGQAWYVSPLDGKRYYLGRPADAFNLMRSFGLGVSNADLANFQKSFPHRLAGRILLQVEDKGQAWYVSPRDEKLYYLGRPNDAFNLMRTQGLGISNQDISVIPLAPSAVSQSASVATTSPFSFKYQGQSYIVDETLTESWYKIYQNSTKVLTYSSANEPANLREAFYGLFLQIKPGDNSIFDITVKLKKLAISNVWSDDQLVEAALSFVQAIAYDHDKLSNSNNRNLNPYYPYETLFLRRGVCSDKTFLAVALLRQLGYGAAILDFPDINHSAVGIACPLADSINNSGYCYGETTNYFPLGVIPQTISAGRAETASDEFSNLFNPTALGQIEIYQRSSGKIYQSLNLTKSKVLTMSASKENLLKRQALLSQQESALREQESALVNLRAQLDAYYVNGQISQYNALIPSYNDEVAKYNAALTSYQESIAFYNSEASKFNKSVQEFYQK